MTRFTQYPPQNQHGRHYPGGQHAPGPMPGMVGQPNNIGQQDPTHRRKSRRFGSRVILSLAIGIAFLAGVMIVGIYLAPNNQWFGLTSFRSASPSQDESSTVIFSGKPNELRAAPGNIVQADQSNSSITWIRSKVTTAKSSGATDGVSVKVPSSLSDEVQGKRIRVTVSARGGSADIPSPFAVAYSTGARNSGWLVFEPTDRFTDFSFNYVVPRSGAGSNHYVGIWSDITGRGAPLAIRQIRITMLR